MNQSLKIAVASLTGSHRVALEELIGAPLPISSEVLIEVRESAHAGRGDPRPAQTVEDWTRIYKGLTEEEIDEIDRLINSRHGLRHDVE